MNDIVVGVKPIANGTIADTDEEAVGSIGALWLTIDGREVACSREGDSNLISVKFEIDQGPCKATVTLIGASLRTARWDDPTDAPERYKRKEDA